MKVIKRNGEEVPFDRGKIEKALLKANPDVAPSEQVSSEEIQKIASRIEGEVNLLDRAVSVEEIQDMVEDALIVFGHPRLMRVYTQYRFKHEQIRKENTTDARILALVDRNNEEAKQENANKNPMINSTQRDYIAGEVSRDITERLLLPPDVVKAHDEGIIHFHDADYFVGHEHNCFSGGTRFITDKGIRQFRDFNDGEAVYVKDMNGDLRIATVHKYGMQEMQKVHLKNGRMERTVICTPNHRWILKDGSVTTHLKEGDILYGLKDSTGYKITNREEAFAFCLGFIIGDGCDHSREGCVGQTQVRLCGRKNEYRWIFEMAGFSSYQIKESDDYVMHIRGEMKQDFLNGRSWRFMTTPLKALLFKGYYAADGAIDSNRVSTVDERIMQLIEDVSGLAGYFITSRSESVRDTEYKKDHRLVTYHFVRYNPVNQMWKVKEIEPYNHRSPVMAYCVEEPATHSFTLEGGIVTGNCCLVNLEDMLQNGTVISGTMIEKPHSFATACNIATQIIAQVASNQYGGQTITLAHLAPFVDVSRQKLRAEVRKELTEAGVNLTMWSAEFEHEVNKIAEERLRKEIERGVQTIQYQIITLMTTNGQAPFVTVFMYIDEVPEGQTRDDLVMIIRETLRQRMEGVKNECGVWITPAFPKLIYVLDEDNMMPDSKYYDVTVLAAECTAKRMVPDYISAKVMLELKGEVYPCMGCRSFLTPDNPEQREGLCNEGNKARAKNYREGEHKYYGRFNQGVVTINLVDAACSSGGDEEKFWEIMDERTELCKKALMCRHNRLLGTPSDVAPILWQNGALARLGKGEVIDPLLYGNYSTLSLGYAGLYECTKYMKGVSHTDPEGRPFALKVMQFLNDKCAKWRAEENISFSLYGTPMESTTYKFAKCLQRRFGMIPDVTDHNYITNSYHVCVREKIDAFSKLSFEADFQKLSPGGAISYVEVPNMQQNISAVLAVMKHIYENIMYAELNTKSDYCQVCGYSGEIKIANVDGKLLWECPNCGNRDMRKMNVARRVCGYIGINDFNQGRMGDIKDRQLHL